MAIDCVDINLDRTPIDADGGWWNDPLGWENWITAFNRRGDSDHFHIGCDPQRLRDRRTYERTFELTASGSTDGRLYLKCGNIGSRFEPSASQDSWWFIGVRTSPMRRQAYRGVTLFKVTGDRLNLEGIKARDYDTVLDFENAINDSAVLNTVCRNATFGLRFRNSVNDLTLNQIVGRDITASLIRLEGNVTNSSITNITLLNTNVEDGEAIGIRLLGSNNQNVKISDIVCGGQHDHYIGDEPKSPYHDGSEYSPYTQGEVLAIEGGFGIVIERVIGFNCTDRLIDCKAQCEISDSGGVIAKRGITMWADNSIATNCVIKTPTNYGNTPATAYLVLGNNSKLLNCFAHMLTRGNSATIIVGKGANILIKGGEYIQNSENPYLQLGASGSGTGPTTVTLENVKINGTIYNTSVTLNTPGDKWFLPN